MLFGRDKSGMVDASEALPGRSEAMPIPATHHVNGAPLAPPWPEGIETAVFAMGCFWGSEELYWQLPGVHSTAVGYAGGHTPNPTYEEACSGRTGHTEAVLVAYDPVIVSYDELLKMFWENHDPTTGMRQGNDVGTQYRSAIYTYGDEQAAAAKASVDLYQEQLAKAGRGEITTEVRPASDAGFFYAEPHHQQYLAKNPNGYRCHAKTGVDYPLSLIGVATRVLSLALSVLFTGGSRTWTRCAHRTTASRACRATRSIRTTRTSPTVTAGPCESTTSMKVTLTRQSCSSCTASPPGATSTGT